jgi:hypothetical protein
MPIQQSRYPSNNRDTRPTIRTLLINLVVADRQCAVTRTPSRLGLAVAAVQSVCAHKLARLVGNVVCCVLARRSLSLSINVHTNT